MEKTIIKKMSYFDGLQIGDDIIVNGDYNGIYFHNKLGKIISELDDEYGVEFKEKITFGHDCKKQGKKGHCFYIGKNIVKKV